MKPDSLVWIIVFLATVDLIAGIVLVWTLALERKYIRQMRREIKMEEGRG